MKWPIFLSYFVERLVTLKIWVKKNHASPSASLVEDDPLLYELED